MLVFGNIDSYSAQLLLVLVELKQRVVQYNCLVLRICIHRPHPNECSGGDLDGDIFFISWDNDLIPCETEPPMDYTGRRSRIMDHDVTLEVDSSQVQP